MNSIEALLPRRPLTIEPGNEHHRFQTRLRWQRRAQAQDSTGLRIAQLATFTIDPLVPYLGVALKDAGIPAVVHVGPYNQIVQQCLSQESQTAHLKPDMLIVYPRFEELWAGEPLPFDDASGRYGAELLYLADASLQAARQWHTQLIFVLPAIPEFRPAGLGDDGNASGVYATAASIRETLRQKLVAQDGVLLLDAEALLRKIGSRNVYRYALLATAHIPFSEEFFDLLAQRLAHLILLQHCPVQPVAAFDCKRLCSPEQAEGQPTLLSRVRDRGGRNHIDSFERYVQEIRRLGVQVASCHSPGSEQQAYAAQLRAIALELSVPVEHIVFFSPRQSALEEIKTHLPQVSALLLPEDQERWPSAVQESGLLDQFLIPSARKRVSSGPLLEASASAQPVALSLDSFLANLRLQVSCIPVSMEQVEEAAEFTRKISEFHMNGHIWSAEQLAHFLRQENCACWSVSVRDRFGDYGPSGLFATRVHGNALTIELFLLSCPVLGKTVEEQVLKHIAQEARRQTCKSIALSYTPTPRNAAFFEFLRTLNVSLPALQRDLPYVAEFSVEDVECGRVFTKPSQCGHVMTQAHSNGQSLLRKYGLFAVPHPVARLLSVTAGLQTATHILDAVQHFSSSGIGERERAGVVAPGTETERILAAIWAKALRLETVSIHDDFFKLGGDSILAVQVISKANQAGLKFTPKQLFEQKTIARLALISAHAPTISAEQHRISGAVPLLPTQHWFFEVIASANPDIHYYYHTYYLEIHPSLQAYHVEQAMQCLLDHHDALRMRFKQTEAGWQQWIQEYEVIFFSSLDLSSIPDEELDVTIEAKAIEIKHRIHLTDGPLVRAAYFYLGQHRRPRLLLIFHHLVVDGVSRVTLLEDLHTACEQLLNGQPVQLPLKTTSNQQWARRLVEYAQAAEVQHDLDYWLSLLQRPTLPLPVDYADGRYTFGSTQIIQLQLSEEDTFVLQRRYPELYQVPVAEVLLAALVLALNEWTGDHACRIALSNHGHETFFADVDVSRTVGWLQDDFPVVFTVDQALDLPGVLQQIHTQLSQIPHHGSSYGFLRYLCQNRAICDRLASFSEPMVDFNHMGEFGLDDLPAGLPLFSLAEGSTGPDQDLQGIWPYALDVFSSIREKRLYIDVMYSSNMYTQASIEKWSHQFEQMIQAFVALGCAIR